MPALFSVPFADVGQGIIPSDGALLYFYYADTETPLDTYSDYAMAIPNSNPVESDANGVFPSIWLNGNYTVVLKDKNGVQIWSAPFVTSFQDSNESRIKLQANITLYVATTGSDSNSGLSPFSPFLTIQKAINTLESSYDLSGHSATIQLANGTYTSGAIVNGSIVGEYGAGIILNGNSSSPSSVVISTTGDCVILNLGGRLTISNLKLVSSAGSCIHSVNASTAFIGSGVIFGSCLGCHIYCASAAAIAYSGYEITGSAAANILSVNGVIFLSPGTTITITGTPNFSSAFCVSINLGLIDIRGQTFSGSATGARYAIDTNGVIYVAGAGATYLPGDVGGSAVTGGQYV